MGDRGPVRNFDGFWRAPPGDPPKFQTDPLDCAAMDRRLARRNLRTGLITAVIALLMFALTFVAAVMYVAE
jgi:predicted secreted protein